MAVFGPNILIYFGGSKTFGTRISENPSALAFGATSQFLFWNRNFWHRGIHYYTQDYNFPLGPSPKKSCFQGTGHFLGLNPYFGHFWGVARQKGNYPYFWSKINKTRVILHFPKYMVIEHFWVLARIGGETAFSEQNTTEKFIKMSKKLLFPMVTLIFSILPYSRAKTSLFHFVHFALRH